MNDLTIRNYQRLTDSQLIERFTTGRDEQAFGELISRHGSVVMSTCRRRLKNEADCQDAFQATFLTLVAKAGWIRQRSSVAGWLQRVAVRIAIDVQRSNARRRTSGQVEDAMDVKATDPEIVLIIEEELARLPANYRSAIVLCHLEGHKSSDAARILAVPRNTLNSWLVRGRALLRKRLARQGVSLSVGGLISTVTSLGRMTNAVQAELVQETARAASLYASGYAATSTAATLAKATLSKMIISTLTRTAVLTLTVSALLATFAPPMAGLMRSASAQVVFFDDFKADESNDGIPDRWLSFESRATLQVIDESLIVSGQSYAAAFADEHSHVDISIESQLRILEGDYAGVSARLTPGAEIDNFFGALATDGTLYLGGGSPHGAVIDLGQVNTTVDPSARDARIRLEVIGTEIRAWAWNVDDEMPVDPMLTATHGGAATGTIGAFAGDFNGDFPVSAAFRFVEATVPEPASFPVAITGFLGLLSICRWRSL